MMMENIHKLGFSHSYFLKYLTDCGQSFCNIVM